MIMTLCTGTDTNGPRAKKALAEYGRLFPITVDVRIVGEPEACAKCGAKRYKLTTESQTNTERMFGFTTKETRTVCESMGALLGRGTK